MHAPDIVFHNYSANERAEGADAVRKHIATIFDLHNAQHTSHMTHFPYILAILVFLLRISASRSSVRHRWARPLSCHS